MGNGRGRRERCSALTTTRNGGRGGSERRLRAELADGAFAVLQRACASEKGCGRGGMRSGSSGTGFGRIQTAEARDMGRIVGAGGGCGFDGQFQQRERGAGAAVGEERADRQVRPVSG